MTIEEVIERLFIQRGGRTTPPVPIQSEIQQFAAGIQHILFPHFDQHSFQTKNELATYLNNIDSIALKSIGREGPELEKIAREVLDQLAQFLPELQMTLQKDAEFIHEGDPAARSTDEVIASYPGFQAILFHRVAHFFWNHSLESFARALSEHAHRKTGIDIHPGARIASPFFIDHGTGIVIGETTVIGERVKLYQGVTLGALSVEKTLASTKRHPTIEDDVVIYASATILGGDTVIGKGSVIGGNVWLTNSIPAHSTVYHNREVTIQTRE